MSDDLERYLRRLGYALSPLPQEERVEIVREIRSHIVDRMEAAPDPSRAYEETVSRLGPPERYARSFLDDYHIAAAVADGSGPAMLRQSFRMAGRGAGAFAALLVFLVLFTLAASLAGVAVLKPIFPGHVGLWYGADHGVLALGFADAETQALASELLGYWVIPIALGVGLVVYRVAVALLRRFLEWFRSTIEAGGVS